MRKFTIVVASVGAIGLISAASACSSSDSAKTGGEASVTVDGQAVDMGSKTVACTEAGGKFMIAIGDTTGAKGVGATLSTGDNPEVQTVALGNTNGQSLGYAKGTPGGEAKVTKDGKKYTITGTATAVDMANPMSPAKKNFEIKVTCP